MRKYSLVIPVYNRPDEIVELLYSLTRQTYTNFEVIVVEDGSQNKCEQEVTQFVGKLDVHYYFKENTGQGFSRNYGFSKATGDFLLVFDSDCIIPESYLQSVEDSLSKNHFDAFGGPDLAHKDFTPVQKAISYAMTSVLTTGGIRGQKKRVGAFHPRSFNMGISRKVWEETQGYIITRMGEDIEFSIRIMEKGFKVGLISEAFVYHKRRASFSQFYKQLHFFGRARINIYRFFSSELKPVHFFPAVFTLYIFSLPILWLIAKPIFNLVYPFLGVYLLLVFIDSFAKTKSLKLAVLSIAAVVTMLTGYGVGFLTELRREFLKF